VLPTLLLALEPRRRETVGEGEGPAPAGPRRVLGGGAWPRALTGALVAAQLLSVAFTFRAFDTEARPLDALLAAAEPHKRVLYLPTAPASAVSFSWPYSHFGQWYQVHRGGLVDFSFAEFFPMWYRYREEYLPGLPDEFDWRPGTFRWSVHHGERFDYLLVRGPVLPEWFEGSPERVYPVAQRHEWTLLGVRHSSAEPSLQSAVLPVP
jgi:hypothetical protein